MRSFDERKAEIFKRSEERINKRTKNRKRILAVCIPLLLCVTVLSVLSLQNFGVSFDGVKEAGSENNAAPLYTSLEITKNSISETAAQSYHDAEAVNRVYTIINSYFSTSESISDKLDNNAEVKDEAANNKYNSDEIENEEDNFKTHSSSVKPDLIITFKSKSGSTITYSLYGNTLINKATDQKVILSDSQLSELKALLNHKSIKEESK